MSILLHWTFLPAIYGVNTFTFLFKVKMEWWPLWQTGQLRSLHLSSTTANCKGGKDKDQGIWLSVHKRMGLQTWKIRVAVSIACPRRGDQNGNMNTWPEEKAWQQGGRWQQEGCAGWPRCKQPPSKIMSILKIRIILQPRIWRRSPVSKSRHQLHHRRSPPEMESENISRSVGQWMMSMK